MKNEGENESTYMRELEKWAGREAEVMRLMETIICHSTKLQLQISLLQGNL